MKKLLFTLLFLPIMVCAQHTTNYKEINIGFPPGASFLWGQTIYYDNNTLLDYEAGFAFPSIGTAKIGYGLGGENFAAVLGVRLFPVFTYIQFNVKERFVFSVEVSPSVYSKLFWREDVRYDEDGNITYYSSYPMYDDFWAEFAHPSMVPAIVTFGWRW